MAKDPKTQVEELARQFDAALDDNLVAFCLFGPAVRHDRSRDRQPLTTLLILRDVSPAALRPIEQPIAGWTRKGHPPPLIFSERGWRASTDVFPIELEDMREAHLLVRGESPFEGVTTRKDDLRRELEREIRAKLLQFRTEFVASASDGKALGNLLLESAGTFFVLFRALLRLVGREPPQERDALVTAVAETARLDVEAFTWILGKMGGKKLPALEAYDPVGDRYLEQIERLASFVDSWH